MSKIIFFLCRLASVFLFCVQIEFFTTYLYAQEISSIDKALSDGNPDQAVSLSKESSNHYLSQLIELAIKRKLSSSSQWHTLMHYKKNFYGKLESQIDGEDFFMSKSGKTNPELELHATLAGFFSQVTIPSNNLTTQCRYVARYEWLKKELQFDPSKLPESDCKEFNIFKRGFRASGFSVVFPSSHPNSPGSMFGHTLLRADRPGQTEATRMMAFSINYAAIADQANVSSFIIKGLTGGFPGRFALLPYHLKLREYAQMENRDIWEYSLNVPTEKVDFVIKHLWEIGPTYSDYYFFTENCSYLVIALLDVVYPDDPMTNDFKSWISPVDTIRSLIARNMVTKISYFPSYYKIIKARQNLISDTENKLALNISLAGLIPHESHFNSLEDSRKVLVLDMAYDYVKYDRFSSSKEVDSKLNTIEKELLLKRSKIKIPSVHLDINPPEHDPTEGHLSSRVELDYGKMDSKDLLHLGWRAVNHDWIDPPQGFNDDSMLEFGNVSFRLFSEEGKNNIRINKIHIIRIENMEQWNRFFRRFSWRVTTGFESFNAKIQDDHLGYILRGGPGLTYRFGNILLYTIIESEIAVSNEFSRGYNVVSGLATGVLGTYFNKWRFHLYGRVMEPLESNFKQSQTVEFIQSYSFSKSVGIHIGVKGYKLLNKWHNEAVAGINLYY